VIYRFGLSAYAQLFAPYAANRWGDPETLSVSVAHLHHGAAAAGEAVALGGSPAGGRAALRARIPEILSGAVRSLRVEGKRVVAIEREGGEIPVEGRVFFAGPPAVVAGWLGDALDAGERWDVGQLHYRARVQVAFKGFDAQRLPGEVHVSSRDVPFFQITRPDLLPGGAGGGFSAVAHLSLDPGHALLAADDAAIAGAVSAGFSRLGLAAPDATSAAVWRLPDYDPSWTGPWHPTQNRVLESLQKRGVYLVGRAGTFRLADPGAELAFGEALAAGDVAPHELQRSLLDPPVMLPGTSPSIGRFVVA
jgi:protoporphyrinogen oxidase